MPTQAVYPWSDRYCMYPDPETSTDPIIEAEPDTNADVQSDLDVGHPARTTDRRHGPPRDLRQSPHTSQVTHSLKL
jgi:hypothetical protein